MVLIVNFYLISIFFLLFPVRIYLFHLWNSENNIDSLIFTLFLFSHYLNFLSIFVLYNIIKIAFIVRNKYKYL